MQAQPKLNFSSVAKKNLDFQMNNKPTSLQQQNQSNTKPKMAKELKSCKSQIRNMEKILLTLKETIAQLESDKLQHLHQTQYLLQSNEQLSYQLKKEQEKTKSLNMLLQQSSPRNSLFNLFATSKNSLYSSNTHSESDDEEDTRKENPIWSTCFLEDTTA
jgi:hypothetical protein